MADSEPTGLGGVASEDVDDSGVAVVERKSDGDLRPHPATFSAELIPVLVDACRPWGNGILLDPFAGIGKANIVADEIGSVFMGFEIEPEWAAWNPNIAVADSTHMNIEDCSVNCVLTSPPYGNRMADRYAGSPRDMEHAKANGSIPRRTYRIALGRDLNEHNAGRYAFNNKYKELCSLVWSEVHRVLKHNGGFVLNVSDHIKDGKQVPVVDWHVDTITRLGFLLDKTTEVATKRFRFGANNERRLPTEKVLRFIKP